MIVGDDDQSIYGWRGAKIENIQRFLTDYQGARTIASSRTTAPPPISSKPPTASSPTTPERLRQGAVDRGSAEGEPISLYAAFNRGGRGPLRGRPPQDWKEKVACSPTAPSSIAPTPSHGCWKRR